MRPARTPIGLHLSQTARVVGRAFDDALARAGGSVPAWLVLLNLKIRPQASQRELAEAVGIREATLTHHLNAMDATGLLTRRRDPGNRRVHLVELTDAGEAAFLRLRDAAIGFDRRLREGFTEADLEHLGGLLDRLARNATDGPPAGGEDPGGPPAGGEPVGGQDPGGQPAGGQPVGGQPAGGRHPA